MSYHPELPTEPIPSPSAVAVVSAQGDILFASPHFTRLLSRADRQSLGGFPGVAGTFEVDGRILEKVLEPLDNGAVLLSFDDLSQRDAEFARRASYISVASHDMRGAVANARSYASLMLSGKMTMDERSRRGAEVIVRNADRALMLMQDFFDACKNDLNALPVEKEPQDILPLLAEAIASTRGAANAKRVQVETDLPEKLPPVLADGQRVAHAAAAFLEHGIFRAGNDQAVRLAAHALPTELRVSVTDAGAPIAPEELSTLFDLEARAIQDRRLEAGFRLGVARAAVEAHGGRVGVDRHPRRGATFFFALPR